MTKRIRIPLIIAFLWITILHPAISFNQEALKIRHIASIYSDGKNQSLKQPEGVVYGKDSFLIVADTGNGRLLKYVYQQGSLGSEILEIKTPQVSYPVSVGVNSKKEIFVLDREQRRIIRLSSEGKFLGYFDPQGQPSFIPKNFYIDGNDNVFILDMQSRCVLMLNSEGKALKQIPLPKESGPLSDLAIDVKGHILLIDGVNAVVYEAAEGSAKFSPLTKGLKEKMRFPVKITTDSRGRIYLIDRNGSAIVVLGQDGSYLDTLSGMGWNEGLLRYPSQMSITDDGEIFIADTRNNRIQIFKILE
jgi:hypothetical protein